MNKPPLSFEDICGLEPEVLEIYAQVKKTKNKESAAHMWVGNIQPRLGMLVGRNARNESLRDYDSFALTIDTIRDALFQPKKN